MLVTEAFYEAAVIPELWKSALDLANTEWDADGVALLSYPDCLGGLINTETLNELCASYIQDEWYKHDIRAARGLAAKGASGALVTDLDLFSAEELTKLPFYADFLHPQGFGWFAGCTLIDTGGVLINLSLQRRVGKSPFSADELARIRRDLPHVKHAARLASRARIAYAEGVLDGLSGFDCGVVLIDHLGRVLRMNSRAETYLGYHLHVVASRLRASHRESNRLLQDLISGLTRSAFRLLQDLISGLTRSALVDRSPEATSVLLPRENSLPLIVSTYPVVRQASDVFQGACGFLIISDMTQERPLALPLLRRMFQLTPAELRVAEGLAYGLDTQQIATQHGIGAQTVRFHLKSIFAKTGTCHQAQLVALLARFDSQPR